MISYNIDQFSKITNIPKLNLRTWENRYSYLVPLRTETNIRVYNDDLLVRGINTKLLLENGYKISKVSKMLDEEIQSAVEKVGVTNNKDIKVDFPLPDTPVTQVKLPVGILRFTLLRLFPEAPLISTNRPFFGILLVCGTSIFFLFDK